MQGVFAPDQIRVFLEGVEAKRLQFHGAKVRLFGVIFGFGAMRAGHKKRRTVGPPFFVFMKARVTGNHRPIKCS